MLHFHETLSREDDMSSTSARVQIVLIAALLAICNASFPAIINKITRASVATPIALLKAGSAAEQTAAAARCSSPYTVRQGDTLSRIAARCGISTALLRQWNRLKSNAIYVGQSLVTKVPGGRRTPVTPSPRRPRPTPSIESTVSPW
jgi:LysM repeat protein